MRHESARATGPGFSHFQGISGAQAVPPTLNDRVRRRSSSRAADRARPRGRRGGAGQPRRGALAADGARGAGRAAGPASRTAWRSTPAARTRAPDLLADAFGSGRRGRAAVLDGFPAALRAGLAHLDQLGADTEWVWVLHDDASPHPEALLALLAGAADDPDADVLGPMLREWPSLKRLLELGVTISGTGRRETGLERGEYDQGQYSEPRHVLAVNTAGMLVRRRVLDELGGLDDELPIFGNDLDFGWRAAAAGHKTVAVPQAVVFHAEAAHRGLRRTPLTGRHTHYQERRAALFTLLANSRSRRLAAAGRPAGVRHLRPDARLPGDPLARARPSTTSRRTSRWCRTRATCWPPGGPVALRPPPTPRPPRSCWRRAGCRTGTGSTPSATWRPRSPSPRPTWPSDAAPRLPSATRRRSRRGARRSASGSRTTRWWRTPGSSPASSPTRSPCCSPSPCSRCSSAPAPRSGTSPARGSRPRRTTGATGGRCTSRPGTSSGSAPRCPRRRTCCRWRCCPPSSAAARPPRCRRCWCSRSRSRCGGRGGSCAWPAGSRPRPARTAG